MLSEKVAKQFIIDQLEIANEKPIREQAEMIKNIKNDLKLSGFTSEEISAMIHECMQKNIRDLFNKLN